MEQNGSVDMERRQIGNSKYALGEQVEAEQVLIESPDIIVTTIRLPGRLVFVASVYILGEDS
jgi:hypothetical protein